MCPPSNSVTHPKPGKGDMGRNHDDLTGLPAARTGSPPPENIQHFQAFDLRKYVAKRGFGCGHLRKRGKRAALAGGLRRV